MSGLNPFASLNLLSATALRLFAGSDTTASLSPRRSGTPARRTRDRPRYSTHAYPRAFRAYNKRYGNGVLAEQRISYRR